jgi:outer membrane protein assembly factor BamB
MWKRRLAIDGLVIVGVVGIAFAVLTWVVPLDQFQKSVPLVPVGQPKPKEPWAPSAQYDAEANANFSVESARPENVHAAGKPSGADWPHFAGSRRDNQSAEKGLLPQWPANGPALAWISRGLGAGFSSVAVVDGVVYTMGNKGASETVIALDAGTGEKLWATPTGWASHPGQGDGPRGTPAVSHGKVFGLGAYGDLTCLDAHTGKPCWHTNVIDEFGSQLPGFGVCESILVDQDRVVCTPGGPLATLVALQAETGQVVWKAAIPEHDHCAFASATIAEVGGVRQYVQFTAEGTLGVRADDGQFLWRDNSAANSQANCSAPLAIGDLVFSSSDYGVGASLGKLLPAASKFKTKLVYHTHEMSSHHGGMVAAGGLVFGSSGPGILTCLDLKTGKPKWRNRSVGKGAITYADGRVYLRSEQGTVALVEATGAGYHELGRFDQPERSKSPDYSYPVVAEGKLFLRDQDVLLCYDLRPRP